MPKGQNDRILLLSGEHLAAAAAVVLDKRRRFYRNEDNGISEQKGRDRKYQGHR